MTDLPREARESLRRLHEDEPVELTNAQAHAASHLLGQVVSHIERHHDVDDELRLTVEIAQANATMALAQEVKNLRLAMYPHSGEAPST